MSADNGVYIGYFPKTESLPGEQRLLRSSRDCIGEIRVVHVQAIDNLWYPDGENSEYITLYFKNGQVFRPDQVNEAREYAFNLCYEQLICEYGVNELIFLKPYSEYQKVSNGQIGSKG